jgi:hypothetical protein
MKDAAMVTLAILIAMLVFYFYADKLQRENAALKQQLADCRAGKK